ncbi:hypothetical protein SUSAZ_10360 [Sulfolobus acidocaldarius SUSAZ]|nr:hypothetical protein SUSAZ_10360 [Sulfolobus acidocaldarius SUSAZ]
MKNIFQLVIVFLVEFHGKCESMLPSLNENLIYIKITK